MALAPARTNIKLAAVNQWGVSDTTQSDTGYSAIPYLKNAKVNIKTIETNNSLGQPMPFAYELAGSAQFPAVRTTANFVKLLDSLGNDLIEHRIVFVDGRIISSKPGTSTPSPTGFGTKWKLVSDSDMSSEMYAEISIARKLTLAEYTQILTSANAPTFGTSATFTNFTSLTRADIVPSGLANVKLGAANAGSYLDVMSNVRSTKFSAELLTTMDSRGQYVGFAIKIDFDIECMETSEVELLKWPAIVDRANECQLNWANGLACSLPNQLGITTEVIADKDSNDISVLKVQGSGIIIPSAWDALWSA
jgi:hypothetical protein